MLKSRDRAYRDLLMGKARDRRRFGFSWNGAATEQMIELG